MRNNVAHCIRVVYMEVLGTTFRMRIDAAYRVRVVYIFKYWTHFSYAHLFDEFYL